MSCYGHTDVVGSLLRPQYLKAGLADESTPRAKIKQLEDRAVDQVIAMQEGVGLDVVTDGEMRRHTFVAPLDEGVDGFETVAGATTIWYSDEGPVEQPMTATITDKLRKRRSVVTEEFAYARARARVPLKVTLASPLMLFLRWTPEHSARAYPDPFEMAADAVEIVRADVQELAEQGCEYVQIDAPELATLVQPETREWFEDRGMPADRMLTEGIDLINAVASGFEGIRFGIHLCRGNRKGQWMASGGYDYIAEALFGRTPAFDTILLEYDDPDRHGDFKPLKAAPDDKQIVLGLLSSKHSELESIASLVSRIDEATRFFPKEQLSLSTQCGFASIVYGNDISESHQEAKLRRVREVADAVWS